EQHYFKTREEMVALFSDLPEAVANTVEIAQRVDYRPREIAPILPKFAAAPDLNEEQAVAAEAGELARQARDGLAARLERFGTAEGKTAAEYAERLETELAIIENMKFPGYFLIVSDFI